jgi:hypothetical protein
MSLRKEMAVGWMYAAVAAMVLATGAGRAQDAAVPAAAAPAQAAAPATAGGTRVHGTIVDPDGELIPGAKITFTPNKGSAARQVTSGSDGTYSINAAPGTYTVVVTMPGFSTYSALNFKVLPAAGQTLDVKMAVGQDVVVNVDDTAAQLSVDPDNNASATIITGKDLDALSDDPDDLAAELSALAGPAAGPNGGTIYIDGFTGGQLPPKASIREIRINQNPFSAQYDKPGFGRVEVFTKPGTDSYHGSASLNGNDNIFNTGSPIVKSNVPQPGYYTLLGYGQLSGPLTKTSSFTFGAQFRSIHDNVIVDPQALYSLTANPGVACAPAQTAGCSTLVSPNGYVASISSPQTRYDLSPRVDFALGSKNTVTARYRFEHATLNNQGFQGNTLPTAAYTGTQSEQDVQTSLNTTISSKVINEIHFEWQRSATGDTPLNATPFVSVSGSFATGGSSVGLTSDVTNHFEYQDYMSIALKKNFIRLGGRVRTTYDTNTTNANANGSFSFLSTTTCPVTTPPTTTCTSTTPGATNTTALQNYINGTASQFGITVYNQPTVHVTSVDAGLYAEDDWKLKPNVTLSFGARYETQNFVGDHADFAPRVAIAYGVGKKKTGGPAVVLRGGFGLFYDRLQIGQQENTVQDNGTNQVPYLVSNPTLSATCSPTVAGQQSATGCSQNATTGHLTTQDVQTAANFGRAYRSPYQEQANAGLDYSPFKNATVSFNYQHVVGIHQLLDANLNANNDVNNNTGAIKDIYLTEGYYRQNQLITNFNYRGSAKWSLSSYYVVNFDTKSDTAGASSQPTNPYNIGADYGRASFATRNTLFLFGTFSLPHLVTLSPLVSARSGQPVNITTGGDNFGYLTNNTRPEFAPAGVPVTAPGQTGAHTFAGCGTFYDPGSSPGNPAGYQQIPVNYCTGPAAFTTNLRISKSFGFGKKNGVAGLTDGPPGGGQGGPPPGGGNRGGGGGGGGGFGGGGGRGGGGGGGGFGRVSTGKKYNFTLGVQFQNIFNVVDRGTPNGTLSSASFGTIQTLAGGLFTTNDAVRRTQLTASFNF